MSYIVNHLWLIIWCILALIHTCYTSSILSCILKENFQKPTRWIFRFFSYSCWGGLIQIKSELIHLHKNMKSTLTVSINVRLKVTRVFCILIRRVIVQEKEFYLKKSWIEENILFLLFISKERVIYCKALKVSTLHFSFQVLQILF